MKRRFAASIVIVLLVVLTGCTRTTLLTGGEEASQSDSNRDDRVVLEFWHTYSDAETEAFENKVIPLFESQHPDIKIHAVRKDYTPQLKDDIFAAAIDNKSPDIMRMDIIWVPEFARKGALVNLMDMNGFEEIRQQFIGDLLTTNLYRGKYYGLPVNANTKVAIYNKKLLTRAGLDSPPATFDELIQAVKRLREQDPELFGIGICCSSGWGALPYFWTFGGKLTDPNYTRASGYLDHPDSIAALEKIHRLFKERIISPSIIGEEPGSWDGILQGQLMMIEEAHWFYTVNATGVNKDLLQDVVVGVFPDDVNTGTSIIGGENLVLFNGSERKEAAWTFMRWMVTEEPQRIMAETGLIPTIKNIRDTGHNEVYDAYLRQLGRAMPRPPVSTWTDIDSVYARMIEYILTEEKPLMVAVQDAVAKIDSLLSMQ